ncbi:MAG: SprT-like domain-containing protein [Patescibacteria group bacterium]|nr:SprT-like domain-containing protein [Patescibacteria group bacterium]
MSYRVTKRRVQYYYHYLNTLIFHSHLPKDIKVVISKKRGVWAAFEYNNKKTPPFIFHFHPLFNSIEHFLNILAHEIIHLIETLEFGRGPLGHGKHFKKWEEKLKKYNFFLKEKY